MWAVCSSWSVLVEVEESGGICILSVLVFKVQGIFRFRVFMRFRTVGGGRGRSGVLGSIVCDF